MADQRTDGTDSGDKYHLERKADEIRRAQRSVFEALPQEIHEPIRISSALGVKGRFRDPRGNGQKRAWSCTLLIISCTIIRMKCKGMISEKKGEGREKRKCKIKCLLSDLWWCFLKTLFKVTGQMKINSNAEERKRQLIGFLYGTAWLLGEHA